MIENGDVERPDLKTLERIAATTGVPVAWLALGVGECPDDAAIRAHCAPPVEDLTPAPTERGAA